MPSKGRFTTDLLLSQVDEYESDSIFIVNDQSKVNSGEWTRSGTGICIRRMEQRLQKLAPPMLNGHPRLCLLEETNGAPVDRKCERVSKTPVAITSQKHFVRHEPSSGLDASLLCRHACNRILYVDYY